jgi:hypothetical protein
MLNASGERYGEYRIRGRRWYAGGLTSESAISACAVIEVTETCLVCSGGPGEPGGYQLVKASSD